MIDVATEKLMLPKATLVKWIKHGAKGLKLEAIKFGTHWRTSEEALQRFGDRQTPTEEKTASPVVPSRTAIQQQRHTEWVDQQLDEWLGIRKCETCKKELNTYKKTVPKKEKLWCPQCLVKLPDATIAQRLRTFRWEAKMAKLVGVLGVEMVSGMERPEEKAE